MTDISDDVTVDYQDNVTLFCTAFGSGVVNITWSTTASISLPDPTTIDTDKDERTSTLTLTSVPLEAVGDYTCSVENPFGSNSDVVNVNVTG